MSSDHIPQLSISIIQVSYKAPKSVISFWEENKTKNQKINQKAKTSTIKLPLPQLYKLK